MCMLEVLVSTSRIQYCAPFFYFYVFALVGKELLTLITFNINYCTFKILDLFVYDSALVSY